MCKCKTILPLGTKVSHCASCCRTFGSVHGFDSHRSRGKCKDPKKMGMVLNGRGYWVRPWSDGNREDPRFL